ncbi:MAG: peroxidase-related enzyme [Myxococcales bacterium]|nr:peroxidase-related enzyme [Myxococcales bacterium]MCB9533935.1 peroxidase-related enzyme [Myxococcales bacterium]
MSFIEAVDPATARGELADTYDRISKARGGVAELMRVHSLNPTAMAAQFELYATLMFGNSELDRRTREMIGVVVSAANRCGYGVAHHTTALRGLQAPADLVDSLAAGELPDAYVSEAVTELLAFARELTLRPQPDAARIERLRELGWSDGSILDAVLVAAYFNNINRVVAGLGVSLEPEFEQTCGPELG